jgi:Holliday junction resolvasome RuvABC ATP-dependent DNA helicase subunit
MTVKEARDTLRMAMVNLAVRTRFPRISIKEVYQAEDLASVVKEYAGQRVQQRLERRR